jgi:heterodisulfide reductase subunit C
MTSSHDAGPPKGTLAAQVLEATGASPMDCYQCGRCAAGCMQNVPGEMEISPTRIMRLLQLEVAFSADTEQAAAFADQALGADTPWLCAGCQACTTRCPQGIDIAAAMDVLRQEGLRQEKESKAKRARDIQALHKTFVEGAIGHGRIHELALIIRYKLRTGHFLQDANLAPAMLAKGKLHLLPGKGVDMKRVQRAAAAIRKAHTDDEGRGR